MRNKINAVKRCFTLLELLVSMAVFTLLMMALMQFLNSSQKLWVSVDQKNDMFENARIALDYMAKDIQCIFYEHDKVPFWKDLTTAATPRLCFATISENIPYIPGSTTNKCYSKLVGTEYFLTKSAANATTVPPNCPHLYICRFGDQTTGWTTNWTGLYVNSITNFTGPPAGVAGANSTAYGAALPLVDATTVDVVYPVIPYVVGLTFTCYKKETNGTWTEINAAGGYEFPYAVNISITMLDKNSYMKWAAMDSTRTLQTDLNSYPDIVKNNVRTFNRMVIIGDRGQ